MEYRIIMATFTEPVPSNPGATGSDKYLPFLNRGEISFADAQIGVIRIEDDDAAFGYLARGGSGSYYDDPGDGQALAETASFGPDGAAQLAAGQRISFQDAIILRDADGNEFYVSFPTYMNYDRDLYPIEIGDRHSVLIVPKSRMDDQGRTIWPQFRPDTIYHISGSYKIGVSQTSVSYDPTAAAPPCFTPGTLIETADGPRPVEELIPQDLILTRDHGPQPLRWIGCVTLGGDRLDLQPNLRPIRIKAGALGPMMPARNLTVSPQHRVLLRSAVAQRMFGTPEVLAAAKHLTNLPGIRALPGGNGVTYLHLLFDRHELVLSNGLWTEALLTGPQALEGLSASARREIFALFPDIAGGNRTTAARHITTGRQGRTLVRRHLENNRAFLPA